MEYPSTADTDMVTARKASSFEELRQLFPSIERAAVAAIEATVAHVESGSCVPGAREFLNSLGIEVPKSDFEYEVTVTVPVRVTLNRTVEADVLEAASGDDTPDALYDIGTYEVADAIRDGAEVVVDPYTSVEVYSSYRR